MKHQLNHENLSFHTYTYQKLQIAKSLLSEKAIITMISQNLVSKYTNLIFKKYIPAA